jgi:DNA-binding protein H-NS
MRKQDLEAMNLDELWLLHEELTVILAEKISAEKRELEKRLTQLNRVEQLTEPESASGARKKDRPRRKYPKVLPKYYNPSEPQETWSGRGKRPRWLVAALRSGHTLEEFRIERTDDAVRGSARRNPQS